MQTGAGEQTISPKCMNKRFLVLISVTWERADLIVTRFPHWLETGTEPFLVQRHGVREADSESGH
jgi:hypothetical protein